MPGPAPAPEAAGGGGGGAQETRRLLCVGNPLLEVRAEVPSTLLVRYELSLNAAVQVEDRHRPLVRELLQGGAKVESVPAGGAVATALTAQGLLRSSEGRQAAGAAAEGRGVQQDEESLLQGSSVALLGGVGRDDLGVRFRDLLQKEGVLPLLSDSAADETGWRAVLRVEPGGAAERDGLGPPPGEEAEAARLGALASATFTGAARDYKLDHLRFKVWEFVEAARVVYVEALFITVSVESVKSIAEHCAKMGNTFCLNLSAPYLCRYFHDRILALLPYTDYVFGSEGEYMALAEHRKESQGENLDGTLSWLAKLPRADGDARRRRHLLATCGKQPAVVASTWQGYGVKVQRYPVPLVRAGRYVCKDGAGDAFAGGFLHGLMVGADLDSCVQTALYAAQVSVQRTGPQFVFKDKPQITRRV